MHYKQMEKTLLVLIFFIFCSPLHAQIVDVKNYESFSSAVAVLQETSENTTLIISEPVELDSNLVIPANTHLVFTNNGSIIKTLSYKLTVEGTIDAPLRQVFKNFVPGDVRFSGGKIKEVYPQWWGAKGDGQTNDSIPIQCAINSGSTVVFLPAGRYLLNQPLNLTNFWEGLTLQGAGMAESSNSSELIGNTGGLVIDATGARYLSLKNFKITAGTSNPSTVGILFARSEQIQFVEFNSVANVTILLPSIPAANNGNGTVAIYNHAAELWRAWNVYLVADNAVVFTGYNIFKIYSAFLPRYDGYPSMSECTIDGASTLKGLKGPCVTIDNGVRIEILNAYFSGGNIDGAFPSAVAFRGASLWDYHITISGHLERNGSWVYTSANVIGLNLDLTGAPCTVIRVDGGSINGANIKFTHFMTGKREEYRLIEVSEKGGGIVNSTIDLLPGQIIFAPAGTFSGNIIRTGQQSCSEAKRSLIVPEDSSFLLLAKDGPVLFK